MDPILGQIMLFAGNFAPRGWALCNGQLLSITTNTALFSILGTVYGGDGVQTFALPNLQGRVPVHVGQLPGGSRYIQGQMAGSESVTLLSSQMPAHTHVVAANSVPDTANSPSPEGAIFANTTDSRSGTGANIYTSTAPNTVMAATTISLTGGNQAHSNMQPYLAMNYCIALVGIFPSRN